MESQSTHAPLAPTRRNIIESSVRLNPTSVYGKGRGAYQVSKELSMREQQLIEKIDMCERKIDEYFLKRDRRDKENLPLKME